MEDNMTEKKFSLKKNRFLVRDRQFYRQFLGMFFTLMLQNILTLSVNLADNIMLGGYSEAALSGVASVNQIQFVYQELLMAIAGGIVILGSQYFGKGQLKPVKIITAHAVRMAMLIAIGLFILVTIAPHQMLSFFTDDEIIIAEGMVYLRLIRWTYFFFCVTQVLLGMLRSIGTVRIALVLSVVTLCVNCSINYVLIYGHFGAPELGVAGAAIGTLTARILEVIILILFLLKKEHSLNFRPKDLLLRNRTLFGDFMKVDYPLLINNSLWGLNMAAQNAILGHMTARAIAANSVASTLYAMVKSGAIGSADTGSFFIARTVGENDLEKARLYSRTMQVLFVIIGLCGSVILYWIRIPVLSLYNLSPGTYDMANTFLIILAVIEIGMAYQMPTNLGIIRGGGSSRWSMICDLVSIWGIVLPLSFFLAFGVHASPVAVMIALNSDQFFKVLPVFLKANFGHWAKQLTRDEI